MLNESGCKLNLISDRSWKYLKNNKVNCCKQVINPKKALIAYGNKTPLKIKGSFETEIGVKGKKENSIIYVIEDGSRNLLGKDTVLKLGILKLGIDNHQAEDLSKKPFPKFKNIIVEIPINSSVNPVRSAIQKDSPSH